ncbi:hypothetical protein K443DRAFT_253851 [Laccaria amethystina LaAM-08-1]|uniref:Uncharacterized protein n=1 Tax=Laccaria amethystina LaAM-08-1 TaxID=1095629 RepID=A0A0C9XID6_9AGAR|nr:hypothetical protein K443DRAFT_253851 [Laccaria amethystina LaAM-08-1]
MKVGFVPTWCISGFGLSRGGFGLAEVRCVYNSLHWFIEAIPFCSKRGVRAHFLMQPSDLCVLLTPPFPILTPRFLSCCQTPFDYSDTAPTHLGGCPFNVRTTNRCTTYVLKHPGYWCIRVWKVAPSRGCGQADA